MYRKNLPLLLMLTAGAVTCIITFIRKYPMLEKLVSLFVVMLIFFLLGSVLKWTLDYFDAQNEKRRLEEGEVIEKEAEDQEDGQNLTQQDLSQEERAPEQDEG